ncbi:S8 family serine peptidase [Micromonospora sp. WMMD712]|uniref:S8 family serine peptidase n=1 Tax=Micromonospora sp. WMMD712 TaxID=3016096 RepID=UPI00249B5869|nr:S8 family serine peptidase [Micromonospora sp. WMMD712]WFE61214.1 S8 family serine peptidase [Micromonospora sp. WMMD712]
MSAVARRAGVGVVGLLVSVGVLATVPARAAEADQPPPLPQAAGTCVGPSPVTARETPWALRHLAPQASWPLTRGAGVVVAVLDTGVSAAAPALAGSVRAGADVTGGRADSDCAGRGTALAGIVAARPTGDAGPTGLAPDAEILPVRVTDANRRISSARLAAGIRLATAARADVILVATGVATGTAEMARAVQAAADRDILVVAAVDDRGQGGGTGPRVGYPAGYPTVLAVNAVGVDGAPGPVAADAGVDLAAPGAGLGIAPRGSGHYTVGGAAVAAAYVAGVAALVRAYHPDLSQAEVRARLERSALPAPGGGPDRGSGAGVLDAYAAVAALAPRQADVPVPVAAGPVAVPARPAPSRAVRVAGLTLLGALVVTVLVAAATLTRRGPGRPARTTPPAGAG